ncbi:MAG: hypothetical protein SFX18_14115 [Pirellulales bacterium]|nr:hypothetical protein [Pirellulales bacterium]
MPPTRLSPSYISPNLRHPRRGNARLAVLAGIALGVLILAVYATSGWWGKLGAVSDHAHDPGAHGGIIVAVGQNHHHIEVIFAEGGVMKFFTLGEDQSKVVPVPKQTVTAYVSTPDKPQAVAVKLESRPQPDDPTGQTSLLEGTLPAEYIGARLLVVVPQMIFDGTRNRFSFQTVDPHEAEMPQKVTAQAERDLYLTPGGKLTAADIQANGGITASEKYRGFKSQHDFSPKPGDPICPITQTKANAQCVWIIDGKKYLFCCPPCIDEFVKLAKESPEKILEPKAYVK